MSRTRGGSVITSFWGRCKLNNWHKIIEFSSVFFSLPVCII
jgi:hypothetical protein